MGIAGTDSDFDFNDPALKEYLAGLDEQYKETKERGRIPIGLPTQFITSKKRTRMRQSNDQPQKN
jgi:hypothetical protein